MERTVASTLLHLTRVRLTNEYPAQIGACLALLSEEQLWWRPHEQANAVGNLVMHLSWSNRYYLEQVIGGRDIGRSRDAEFAARATVSRSQIEAMWQDSVARVGEVLEELQPSQMEQSTDRTGKPTTYGQILMHVTHHTATHMGQIVWITKMLHPGGLDEVWFAARLR